MWGGNSCGFVNNGDEANHGQQQQKDRAISQGGKRRSVIGGHELANRASTDMGRQLGCPDRFPVGSSDENVIMSGRRKAVCMKRGMDKRQADADVQDGSQRHKAH